MKKVTPNLFRKRAAARSAAGAAADAVAPVVDPESVNGKKSIKKSNSKPKDNE